MHPLTRKEKGHLLDTFFRTHPGLRRLNAHEKDALAAALHGYKRLKPLLKRIDDTLESKGAFLEEEEVQGLKEKVLRERIAIAKVLNQINL